MKYEDSVESSALTHPRPSNLYSAFLLFKLQTTISYFFMVPIIPIYYNMVLRNNISMLRSVHKIYQLNK